MPTLLRVAGGFSVSIYVNDHRPAHVHVWGPDGRCVFNLNCPDGPLALREVTGSITIDRARRIEREITPKVGALCFAWRRIHGHYH